MNKTNKQTNLVVFSLHKNQLHSSIYQFVPVTTDKNFASSDSPQSNVKHFLNHIDLHIRITVTLLVGVVIPSSMGQSASSTS